MTLVTKVCPRVQCLDPLCILSTWHRALNFHHYAGDSCTSATSPPLSPVPSVSYQLPTEQKKIMSSILLHIIKLDSWLWSQSQCSTVMWMVPYLHLRRSTTCSFQFHFKFITTCNTLGSLPYRDQQHDTPTFIHLHWLSVKSYISQKNSSPINLSIPLSEHLSGLVQPLHSFLIPQTRLFFGAAASDQHALVPKTFRSVGSHRNMKAELCLKYFICFKIYISLQSQKIKSLVEFLTVCSFSSFCSFIFQENKEKSAETIRGTVRQDTLQVTLKDTRWGQRSVSCKCDSTYGWTVKGQNNLLNTKCSAPNIQQLLLWGPCVLCPCESMASASTAMLEVLSWLSS